MVLLICAKHPAGTVEEKTFFKSVFLSPPVVSGKKNATIKIVAVFTIKLHIMRFGHPKTMTQAKQTL
jgi:hypothetical protein